MFISNYLVTFNATTAAIKAGYSSKTAYSIGNRLLKNVEVKAAIDCRLAEMQSRLIADAQEVLEYLTRIIRGEETEFIALNSGKVFELPPRCRDRIKACEIFLRVYGAFNQREENTTDAAKLFVDTLQKIYADDESKLEEKFIGV